MKRCGEVWGYAVAVLRRVGPNHNEAESIREFEKIRMTPLVRFENSILFRNMTMHPMEKKGRMYPRMITRSKPV